MKRSRTFTTLSNFVSFCQFQFIDVRLLKLFSKLFFSIEGKLKCQKVSEGSTPLNNQLLLQGRVKEERDNKQGEEKNDALQVSEVEVKMVMDRLGIVYDDDEAKEDLQQHKFGEDEVANLFDEDSVSLAELKTAFDVFDSNCDGKIDAGELQRVLKGLGLSERSSAEDCAKMINVFDENGDKAIDFEEFVKLMEKCSR